MFTEKEFIRDALRYEKLTKNFKKKIARESENKQSQKKQK
jgi:hypothetical protein